MRTFTCGACFGKFTDAQSGMCPHPTFKPQTQTERLVAFLRTHPQATSLEITLACGIVNTTGRISDARAAGHVIECVRRSDGRQGYVVVDEPVQLQAFG